MSNYYKMTIFVSLLNQNGPLSFLLWRMFRALTLE